MDQAFARSCWANTSGLLKEQASNCISIVWPCARCCERTVRTSHSVCGQTLAVALASMTGSSLGKAEKLAEGLESGLALGPQACALTAMAHCLELSFHSASTGHPLGKQPLGLGIWRLLCSCLLICSLLWGKRGPHASLRMCVLSHGIIPLCVHRSARPAGPACPLLPPMPLECLSP